MTYHVDLDAEPLLERGYKLFLHQKGGIFEWNPSRISLCHSEWHGIGRSNGYGLLYELRYKRHFNANLLDFWLAHTDLIPDEIEDKTILFCGTIYKHRTTGHNYVRCLYRVYERLLTCYVPLSGELRRNDCAAFLYRRRGRHSEIKRGHLWGALIRSSLFYCFCRFSLAVPFRTLGRCLPALAPRRHMVGVHLVQLP